MVLYKHLLCAVILIAVFMTAYHWGKRSDERRRTRERRKIWEQEQAKLPRAIKKS